MQATVPILLCLVAYALLMLSISWYWMKRIKTSTDFLVGGRGLPVWVLIGTITATTVGTGVTLGASGLAYRSGWAGSVYPIGMGLGAIIVGVFFSKMREYKLMTLAEEISCYYSGNRIVLEFVNVSLFLSQVFWLTVQIIGAGYVLSVITGASVALSTIASGALIAMMAIPGGLLTVVYTDVVQAVILTVGFLALTYFALNHTGGLEHMRTRVPAAYFSFLGHDAIGYKRIFTILLALMLSIVADPSRRMLMYSARSAVAAKLSMIAAGIIAIVFSTTVVVAGMYAYYLNPAIEQQDQALPWLIINVLPTWLAALMVVSVASAAYSSGTTNAATVSTYFVRHIYPLVTKRYPKNPLSTVRWALICLFIVSTLLALYAENIVDFVVDFLSLLISGLAVIVLLGRFWDRATWQGALAALIVAFVVATFILYVPGQRERWGDAMIPATLAGLVAHVTVSCCTPRKTVSFEETAEVMRRERHHIELGT